MRHSSRTSTSERACWRGRFGLRAMRGGSAEEGGSRSHLGMSASLALGIAVATAPSPKTEGGGFEPPTGPKASAAPRAPLQSTALPPLHANRHHKP
jgi:hypothetical protein